MSEVQGMVKFAEMYGTVCGSRNCDNCVVNLVKGEDMDCAEFARRFPKKFVSLIKDEFQGGVTYTEEYRLRFPMCTLNADDMVALGMCRRAIFEGYTECEDMSDENCKACWESRYIADAETIDDEEEDF